MKLHINATQFGGAPLFKKFSMFHSGLIPMERYRRDMYRFDAVSPRSLRADLFIGEPGQAFGEVVTGDENNITYDFRQLDELVLLLKEHGVLPYWAWCYIPLPVQVGQDFRSGPSDMQLYASILEHFAAHYRESGLRLGHQEVYNEPDCHDVFFTGDYDAYVRMYEAGALALRRGDPDAVVGGPSTAFVYDDATQKINLAKFRDRVRKHQLPLDFFSYHSYGYENEIYCRRTEMVREVLGDDPYFKCTELHMNELNVVPAPWQYDSEGGQLLSSRRLLPLVLDAIRKLAEYTDVTLVHWAQLLDSGVDALGLVDANGKPRPAYAAFEIYQRMPTRRLKTEMLDNLQMMASADANRVSMVLWGAANENTDILLDWADLPFDEGTVSVSLLDEAFFETYDGHMLATHELPLRQEPLALTLQPDTVAYVEINRPSAGAPLCKAAAHDYVRTHYYFENRDKNTIAWYDELTRRTVLGMGNNEKGLAVCASEIDTKQEMLHIEVISEELVRPQAYRAVRLDFATTDGYEKAVIYTNQSDAAFPMLPLGTGKAAAAVQPWAQGCLDVKLAQAAPQGWTGRLLVTFVLKDAGTDSWLELQID